MIKINFSDFWPGFEDNNLLMKFLERHFPVIIDEKPDYLFYSVYGRRHLQFDNCVKILFTGENLVPDFNLCDYAMGFHYLDFGDRYLRFPLYVYYQWYYNSLHMGGAPLKSSYQEPDDLAGRKFCNFVYSNNVNSDPIRDAFFHELSKYRKVDSGGRHLNNIGKPVADKLEFIKNYKFTIAFENSSVPGYTTEKLLEPILVRSLPIYFGNPLVQMDFNVNSFIWVKSGNDFNRAIKEIIHLDEHESVYLEMIHMPKFRTENNLNVWEVKLHEFVKNIFNQPFTDAFRRAEYGYNKFNVEELKARTKFYDKRKVSNHIKSNLKVFMKKYLKGISEN